MALPKQLEANFLPEEIQFIVENEPIRILPRITTRQTRKQLRNNFTHTQTFNMWKLITTDDSNINKMVAMQSIEISLWLAFILKQQGKCSIIAPSWLTIKQLDKYIEFELKNPSQFSDLPWNWLILSQLLFSKAKDDFRDPVHTLRSKVQDLREIRLGKISQGLKHLNESHLQLDNLSLSEINEMRTFAIGVMNKLKDIHATTNADVDPDNNRNQIY